MPETNEMTRPLPAGVTDPDAVLTERTVHLVKTGQMRPTPNAIYALCRDWELAYGPQRDDL